MKISCTMPLEVQINFEQGLPKKNKVVVHVCPRLFQPLSATPHLRPVKIAVNDDSTGSIFIYTPLSLGQADKKGDSCSVGQFLTIVLLTFFYFFLLIIVNPFMTPFMNFFVSFSFLLNINIQYNLILLFPRAKIIIAYKGNLSLQIFNGWLKICVRCSCRSLTLSQWSCSCCIW